MIKLILIILAVIIFGAIGGWLFYPLGELSAIESPETKRKYGPKRHCDCCEREDK